MTNLYGRYAREGNGEMFFLQWIISQEPRPDSIGSLAADVLSDRDHLRPGAVIGPEFEYRTWRYYLIRKGASDAALETFERAWREYLAERGIENTRILSAHLDGRDDRVTEAMAGIETAAV